MQKLFLLALIGLGLIPRSYGQTVLYVAPDGNDAAAGTVARPLKTLEAALRKVASAKTPAVTIRLRAGRYALLQPVSITPDLLNGHRLEIAAAAGEPVVLSGAVPLRPDWQPYKGNILQTSLDKGLSIDQLYANGLPLSMARYPNATPEARVFNGTAADAISPQRVRTWANPLGGYVHALHQGEWGDFHYRITGKTGDSLHLEGGWQNNRPAPMHREHRFVENIFEELDAPGEWFYNPVTGTLYLYPPAGMDLKKASFERSVSDGLIRITGTQNAPAEHVTLTGLTFTGTNRTFMLTREPLLPSDWTIYRGGAVLTEGAQHCVIRNCTFRYLGGHAVFVSRFNRGITVEHNHIHHNGGNAIAFVGDPDAVRSPAFRYEDKVPVAGMDKTPGPKSDNYPAQCTAHDNLIHHIGTIEKQVAGVEISMAMAITVSHNTIYQVPRAGINIGDGCWGGHDIAFNDVFDTVLETGDHGAFNSWGRDRFWLPGISDVNALVAQYPTLPLADVIKPITLRNNRFHCEHGWDIDLDDGSSNYQISNNLCLNGGLKLREGFNRTVTNNILVNNTFHPHVWYAKSNDIFEHNIVTTDYAPIRVPVWGQRVDHNFFIAPGALEQAQARLTDRNSLHGNPQFMHDAAGDFRVKTGSKALAVGFRNFPMDAFGVVSPTLRKLAARPAITGIRLLATGKAGATTAWLGATIKNLETLGEQSASGAPDKQGVLLVSVSPNSLAARSGLEPGDVIRQINGKAISGVAEMLSLLQTVMWQGHVKATMLHNQQTKEVEIRLK